MKEISLSLSDLKIRFQGIYTASYTFKIEIR